MSEKIPIMKLGVVKEIVEATGMGISYAYEDLVFLDHNALLLQFTQDTDTRLSSFFFLTELIGLFRKHLYTLFQ